MDVLGKVVRGANGQRALFLVVRAEPTSDDLVSKRPTKALDDAGITHSLIQVRIMPDWPPRTPKL